MRIQFCTAMLDESVEALRPQFSKEGVGGWGFDILQRCY
ncbi:hypothetical protein EYC93_15845 [Enterobacter hormaechei]|nr:hypothetical protein EYC92_23300 [Enterobacter hormaechei]KAA0865464.1 hypothetical protein EYC93_15845 [Enterobacter hormaechei]RTO88318.1 hypothetical protein EKN60_12380 [Enterobacter hormaechei]